MPNPLEVAVLVVRGFQFEDWDTVWMQDRLGDAWPTFRFTCAERAPARKFWSELQFKPGDDCSIYLGGALAFEGIITQRQTAYDARSHQVLLSGKGKAWAGATSSVKTKDNNFDKKTPVEAIKKVFEPYGDVKTKGKVDLTPFPKLQCHPGELIGDFADRVCRMRGALLSSDQDGNLLLVGERPVSIVQNLVEGENILKMQCVFSADALGKLYSSSSQMQLGNRVSPREGTEKEVSSGGSAPFKRFILTPAENPGTIEELKKRNGYEKMWREMEQIRAFITVQGWFRDGKKLWEPGDSVMVNAPMAMIVQEPMSIQGVVFQQDNAGGTITTLEMVPPWGLLGVNQSGSKNYSSTPAPSTDQKVTSDQPSTDLNWPVDPASP